MPCASKGRKSRRSPSGACTWCIRRGGQRSWADHTPGTALPCIQSDDQGRSLSSRDRPRPAPGFQGRDPREKGKLLRWFTISRAIVKVCRAAFSWCAIPWAWIYDPGGSCSRLHGVKLDYAEFLKAGERVLNLERAFNVREGFRRRDDRHHPHATEDVPYFNYPGYLQNCSMACWMILPANGWDLATSIPTADKLHELGLQDVAEQLKHLTAETMP